MINEILTSQGFRVWFDKTSLLPGKNWEEGFSDGLVKSRVLVPIISRNSLNHPTNPRSNITLLDENSPCDNVLLEYALALELKERGLLTQIYPVLIGDFDDDKKEYLDYFASGCYPKDVKNIIVKSVDVNVISHLNRLGLGSRLTDNEGVKNIIESIFKSQGIVLKGPEDNSFATIIKDVESMKLSTRVSSDLHHAEKINEILTTQGYKVWFDKTSLLPGKNWEEGFSDGLVKSRMLVPIISRNSLNHPTNPRSNITLLDENSPCDNVLLEYALALELKERGLLTQIYPVLIGDFDNEKHEYLDYFASGCYPKDVKNIIVKSIDKNVRSHLNRLGLGSRLTDNEGVKNIIESIFKSQGFIMLGYQDNAFMSIIKDVKTMKSTV
eukprot:gene17547-23110_t